MLFRSASKEIVIPSVTPQNRSLASADVSLTGQKQAECGCFDGDSAEFKGAEIRINCQTLIGLTLALLIPLNSTALPLIQMREKIVFVFRGDDYAQSSKFADGSASWVIGHQRMTEYRLFFAPDQQTFEWVLTPMGAWA